MGLGRRLNAIYVNIWDEDGISKMIQTMKTELETPMQFLGESRVSRIV